jgi:two-component system response regulator RpfG
MATVLFKDLKSYPLIASVMVIDDQITSRIILESILKTIGNNISVRTFDNAVSALRVAEEDPPDLIIADYKMPELDGVEFTRRLRAMPSCMDIPVIIVTIIDDKSILYEALEAGATDFLNKPIDHYECKVRCRNLLTLRRQQLIIRNRASSVETQIKEAIQQAQSREKDTLQVLAQYGLTRDDYTDIRNHRIGRIAAIVAGTMGMEPEFCNTIETAATLNDIGKIGVPDRILLKNGPLEPDELEIMKSHTTLGYDMLKNSVSPYLRMAATIALYHHEMFNGEGYPHGLHGEDIPLAARITAVAETFNALISRRPYREARDIEDALNEILALKGSKLDPQCVDAFISQKDEIISYIQGLPDSQANHF